VCVTSVCVCVCVCVCVREREREREGFNDLILLSSLAGSTQKPEAKRCHECSH
jgi:hypothetical protein